MPVEFTYHETTDAVSHDIRNDASLTPQEAQVIATLQVAEQLSELVEVFKDMQHGMEWDAKNKEQG